jgi:sec-independent protein translocase protein TatA
MSIGVWQVILILVIVLIIFGAGKLPRVMGDVAKGIKNFKSGMAEPEKDEKDKGATEGEGEKKTIDDSAAAAKRSESEVKNG